MSDDPDNPGPSAPVPAEVRVCGQECPRSENNPGPPASVLAESAPAEDSPVDCWNRVGVYGNSQCPELARFIHCRNCPVYSTAGLQLLKREMPDSYRQWWTSHFSQVRKPAAPAEESVVLFKVSSEWLALPTQAVQEVAECRQIHSLPHRNQGIVLGLTNIRGELVTCISLGQLMAMERLPSREVLRTQHRRLLVTSWFGQRLAVPVDEVCGTERFRTQDLKTPPSVIGASVPGYIQAILDWRGRTVGLLDADVLFSTIERNLM